MSTKVEAQNIMKKFEFRQQIVSVRVYGVFRSIVKMVKSVSAAIIVTSLGL